MTYEESAALMRDAEFRGRIQVACLRFASYILGEPPDTTAHNSRYKWASSTALQPEGAALQVQPMVVMDSAVQQDGKNISDENLQTAVENTVNKLI